MASQLRMSGENAMMNFSSMRGSSMQSQPASYRRYPDGMNVSQLSQNVSPSPKNNLSVVRGSYSFAPRCATSSKVIQKGYNLPRPLGQARNMRLADNAQERILKRIED